MADPPKRNPIPGTGDYQVPQNMGVGVAAGHVLSGPASPVAAARARANLLEGNSGDFHDLVDILRRIYPPTGGTKVFIGQPGQIGRIIRNNQPVADRQTLTMAASQHPLPNTGPYRTRDAPYPVASGDDMYGPVPPRVAASAVPGSWSDLVTLIKNIYPEGSDPRSWSIANSQALGDRPVTTMTNPLPNYQQLQMTKLRLIDQLRTLINQHAAGQQRPLVNTPLPGGATQMGYG